MNIAFYSPLKSPNARTPSGDRQIARNLILALERAGFTISLASELRTYDGTGEVARQTNLQTAGGMEAKRIIGQIRSGDLPRPDLWLTYHVYHKAPDWIGPAVTAEFAIPYAIVEASVSPKQARGKWQAGHDAACAAVAAADIIVGLNPRDEECVRARMKSAAAYTLLPPFIETQQFRDAAPGRERVRNTLLRQATVRDASVWLLAVGMMREGDKYHSYEQLAAALRYLSDAPWHLFVVGDGAAREPVYDTFSGLSEQVTWLGEKQPCDMPGIYTAMDILTWPAVNEALGMIFLEAGASGLPVVAGYTDGVASIVQDESTGLLVPPDEIETFAEAIRNLIDDPDKRTRLASNAMRHIHDHHSLDTASRVLADALHRPVA